MKLLSTFLCFIYLTFTLPINGQKIINLSSPDGDIRFSLKLSNKSMMYSVSFKGKTIIDYSSLSLKFDTDNFENNLIINKPVFRDTTEDYELIVGKTKQVHAHYNNPR